VTSNRIININEANKRKPQHNGIVLPDGTPAVEEPKGDPVQMTALAVVNTLRQLPDLAEVLAGMIGEPGEELTHGQQVTMRAMDLTAKWQVEARELVEWSMREMGGGDAD